MSALDQPATENPAPPETVSSKLWQAIVLFLPSPVREAIRQGLLRTLVYLGASLTVLPLLIAFLAAFWLSVIKHHVGLDFVQSLRGSYVRSIHEGFGIDELVARKLDYVQAIVVDLQPKGPPVNFPIYLEPQQHARIMLTTVLPNSPKSADCRFEDVERQKTLVAVRLGGLTVLQCPTIVDGTCSRTLDQEWWRKNADSFSRDLQEMPPLTIARDEGFAGTCAQLEVEGRVMVYKNVYQ